MRKAGTLHLPLTLLLGALAAGCTSPPPKVEEKPDAGQPPTANEEPAPTRVRRLTRAEYDNTASAVLGRPVTVGQSFAAEDTVLGFSTHDKLQVSALLLDQVDTAAAALARQAVEDLSTLHTCKSGQAEQDCARDLIAAVGARAFRRPLTDEERSDLLALYTAGRDGGTFRDGVELVLQGMFSSASFLYRGELGPTGASPGAVVELTPHEVASALSYLVTAGPPDAALLSAAGSGALADGEERVRQVRRLVGTPAARKHLHRFVVEWLGLTKVGSLNKNNLVFPQFDTSLRESMQGEMDAFIDHVLANEKGSLRALLAADYTLADDRMAEFYGLTQRPGTSFSRVPLPSQRAGILTQASLLATYSTFDSGSPIRRGKFVLDRLLCIYIPPPPPDVVTVPPEPRPDSTTRERTAAHTRDPMCSGCHRQIDPIGFGLEDFDGLGGHRTRENGRTVDASGSVVLAGNTFSFTGGAQLARQLAGDDSVADCLALQVFRYGLGRDSLDGDLQSLESMRSQLRAGERTLAAAFESLVRTPAFTRRRVPSP
ncbi:DUF1592 domain-containing protein [Archangium violaceum]|uniref:DUF1592 domain-containing protein n=1 Tax=Archangium violaceum TaxID=83451 RepID=UPI001EF4DA87|nr:DUF1592 domain-containing protein [Archangium violaceum]